MAGDYNPYVLEQVDRTAEIIRKACEHTFGEEPTIEEMMQSVQNFRAMCESYGWTVERAEIRGHHIDAVVTPVFPLTHIKINPGI